MGAEYGVWSDWAGGFIATQCYSVAEAEKDLERYVAEGEDREDLKVLEMCTDHRDEEQPKDSCEMCFAEEE